MPNSGSVMDRRRPEAPGAPGRGRMERRALALMTDTAANALLGMVFWVAAARLYTADEVGRASAIITAATLLCTLSQLNLGNVYARFLGGAGHRQRRMVFTGYAGVVGLAVVLGAAYAVLGPGAVLFADAWEAWLFPAAVAVLAIFVLQDMILISLDRAFWVPVENITWGVAKLGMLIALATVQPVHGIVLSWIVPAIVALLAVTAYLLFRKWPHHPPIAIPDRRELTSAVGGEYVIGLVSTAVPLALPLLVVHELGLAANAYFSVPWLFATSLSLLMWNVASILLVEAANRPDEMAALLRRALRMALLVGVAGGLGIWFLGPWLLSLLGPEYAESSRWLLRLTGLAAPAVAVVVVWTTAARSQGWLRRVLGLQLCIGAGILGLSSLLLGTWGVTGIGAAFLMVQVTAAAVVLRSLLRMVREPRRSGRHRYPGRGPRTVYRLDHDLQWVRRA
jgi:O-antigen/teichoic acid export membrane protein